MCHFCADEAQVIMAAVPIASYVLMKTRQLLRRKR
jgi:hypothetical protein